MKWWSKANRDICATLQRVEIMQHAHQAALQALAGRLDRLTDSLDADVRYRLTAATRQAGPSPISLAQSGAGINDLIRHCGLRAAEAELLLALYGDRQSDSNVTQVA